LVCFDGGQGWCGFGREAAWLGRRSSGGAATSWDGRTAAVMRPGCADGTEQWEGRFGPEREREREREREGGREREVRLTDSNDAA
jgi:hypothetical protein